MVSEERFSSQTLTSVFVSDKTGKWFFFKEISPLNEINYHEMWMPNMHVTVVSSIGI